MSKAQMNYLSNAFKAALENPECVAELARMFIDAKFVDGETGRRETQLIYDDLKPAFDRYFR
jgi:hypothetical protein